MNRSDHTTLVRLSSFDPTSADNIAGFKPVSLLATTKYTRAWPGGSGGFKLGAK
jgi:hypothetical protein